MTDFDDQSNANAPLDADPIEETYIPFHLRDTDTADTTESSGDVAADTVEDTPALDETSGAEDSASFVFLLVALLALVGGSVYFVGQIMLADNKTDEAEQRAEAIIAEFDPNEFQSNLTEEDLTPSSLPLIDDTDDIEDADIEDADTTVEPAETTTTVAAAPREVINPQDIAVAFINRVPGDEYGFVGYIDQFGERRITQLECDRLDRNINGGICLSATAGINGTGVGFLLDAGLAQTKRFGVSKPSRAAVSPSGRIVAWTGFTLGHTYLNPGEFGTRAQLIDVERRLPANLEDDFVTYVGDRVLDEDTRNYWGVSFVDDDVFYATVGTADSVSLVRGQVSTSRIDVVFENASCPAISPDGKTIVAKEQRGDSFQLVAIDVETGQRRDLGETRSIDDQVEWADDNNIIYAVPNPEEGTEAQPVFDVYALNVAPGSSPRLLIPFADSPAA